MTADEAAVRSGGDDASRELQSTTDLRVISVMRIALVACALAGCAYQPGSFAAPRNEFSGQRATIGCLDLSVERRADVPIGPVLGYQFANRCDHPTTVDLAAIAVIGRDAAGGEVALRAYDPRGELRPVALDARNVGAEQLAYPASREMAQVCADISTFAPAQPPRWLCFGGPGPSDRPPPATTVVGRLP